MYVRPEDVADVTRELENYQKFRDLTRRWIELEIELAKIRRSNSSAGNGRSNRQKGVKKQKKTE